MCFKCGLLGHQKWIALQTTLWITNYLHRGTLVEFLDLKTENSCSSTQLPSPQPRTCWQSSFEPNQSKKVQVQCRWWQPMRRVTSHGQNCSQLVFLFSGFYLKWVFWQGYIRWGFELGDFLMMGIRVSLRFVVEWGWWFDSKIRSDWNETRMGNLGFDLVMSGCTLSLGV